MTMKDIIGKYMLRRILIILEMIKFEHTLFALPFALTSALVATDGLPTWKQVFWLLVAMVGARSSAMTVNRIVDIGYDRINPRTAGRALPTGQITVLHAWIFAILCASLLVLAAGMLNPIALYLSPVALIIIWGYSYTKRFTELSHLLLGLALGIAPAGAWIALTGQLPFPPMVLSLAVILWTGGFDIIYSCQDFDFDRKSKLFSLPVMIGISKSLMVSSLLHLSAFGLLIIFGYTAHLRFGYFTGLLPVAILLVYQHYIVRPDDLSKANAAFFTANGLVSMVVLAGTAIDLIMLK